MGWAWAQWVLLPTVVWLTRNLTLVSEFEGGWRVILSKRAFSEKVPGYNASLELWTRWGPRDFLWLFCSNLRMPSPESRYRRVSLWTAVGLVSLRMFLKQDILPGVRKLSLQWLNHCSPLLGLTHKLKMSQSLMFWIGSKHGDYDPGGSQNFQGAIICSHNSKLL